MNLFFKFTTIFTILITFTGCLPSTPKSDYIVALKATTIANDAEYRPANIENLTTEMYVSNLVEVAELYIGAEHKADSELKWAVESEKDNTKIVAASNENIIVKLSTIYTGESIEVDTSNIKVYNAKTKIILDEDFYYYAMSDDLLKSFKTVANQSLILVKDELQKILLNFNLEKAISEFKTQNSSGVILDRSPTSGYIDDVLDYDPKPGVILDPSPTSGARLAPKPSSGLTLDPSKPQPLSANKGKDNPFKSLTAHITEYEVLKTVYFHNASHASTVRTDYLVAGTTFVVSRTENGYGYTEFVDNSTGITRKGWLLLDGSVNIK